MHSAPLTASLSTLGILHWQGAVLEAMPVIPDHIPALLGTCRMGFRRDYGLDGADNHREYELLVTAADPT